MAWKCSCGRTWINRGHLLWHSGKASGAHELLGWEDEATGEITEDKPQVNKGQKVKDASRVPGTVPTTAVSDATILKLFPKAIAIAMTPGIMIPYMCALKRGFGEDLEAFLSMVCEDFWIGRNINPYAEVAGKEAIGVGRSGPKGQMEGEAGGEGGRQPN